VPKPSRSTVAEFQAPNVAFDVVGVGTYGKASTLRIDREVSVFRFVNLVVVLVSVGDADGGHVNPRLEENGQARGRASSVNDGIGIQKFAFASEEILEFIFEADITSQPKLAARPPFNGCGDRPGRAHLEGQVVEGIAVEL
jgi:hypothetical protein